MTEPTRTCVGCGRKAPKRELRRFVAREGIVTQDPSGRATGRGAYTCPRRSCLERAEARRSFSRVLRETAFVPADLKTTLEGG